MKNSVEISKDKYKKVNLELIKLTEELKQIQKTIINLVKENYKDGKINTNS